MGLIKLSSLSLTLVCVLSSLTMFGQKAYFKAEKQFQLKAYDLAADNYERALSENKDCLNCIYGLAMSNKMMNKNMEAYNWFSELEDVYSEPQFYFQYAQVLKELGKLNVAKEYFQKYSEFDPLLGDHYAMSCDFAQAQLKESDKYKVSLAEWNTKESDFSPSIFRDRILFSSYQNADLPLVNNHKTVNYSCAANGVGTISNFEFLNESRLSQNNITAISITDDYYCAYIKHNFVNGYTQTDADEMDLGIFLATLDEDGILRNETPFSYNSIGYANAYPAFADNGNALFFASNMPGGFGGFDLYVSYNENGRWSEPINLGANINTQGNEITPFVTDKTLYFSSDFIMGIGGMDIFKSEEVDGLFAKASNLGKGINSPEDDLFPVYLAEEDAMYFTSNRIGGKGKHDIYIAYGVNTNNYLSNIAIETATVSDVATVEIPEALNLNTLVVKNTVDIPLDNIVSVSHVNETAVKNVISEEIAIAKTVAVEAESMSARKVTDGEVIFNDGEKVFFIQLAAFFSTSGNMDKFQNVAQFGNIYRIYQTNSTKIKLGYFYDRSQANQILAQVRANGFGDAFVTHEKLNTGSMELALSDTGLSTSNAGSYSTYTSPETTSYTPSTQHDTHSSYYEANQNTNSYVEPYAPSSSVVYKVRLASYEDPIWFDLKKVKDLGEIEQWSKNNWTIFVLSGFNSYEDAENARIKSYNRGFRDASVVIDNNGILEKLSSN